MATDNTLKILIQLGVIGQEDAKAVNDLLKETETSAKGLNAATTDTTSTVKDFTKETVAADKALRDQGVSLEGSGRLFGALNRVVPGLGASLHAAFSGPLGPIILVGIALAEVREKLKAYNEELDAITAAEMTAHADAVKKLKSSWDDAKESLGKYQAAMAHVGEDNDPIATAIAREKELETARIEGSKRLIERLGQEEQAAIRRNAALRYIPQEQLDAQLAAAKAATDAKLKAADDAKPSGDIALMQIELDRRTKAQASLAAREEQARGPAAEAASKLEMRKAELAAERKKNADALEEAQAVVESYEAVKNGTDGLKDQWRIITSSGSYGDALRRRDAAAVEMEKSIQRQQQIESGLTPEVKDAAEKAAALENARQANLDNRKRYMELPAEIAQAQAVEALKKNPNANVPSPLGKLEVPTAQQKPDDTKFMAGTKAQALDNFREFEAAHLALEQGAQLSKGQMEKVGRIADAMAGHHVQSKALLDFMRDVLNHNAQRDAAFDRELEEIRRTMRPHISNYK